jgi:hypothetical protein
MIIHEASKAISAAIPDVPDERAMMEEPTMLFEEAVAQPVVEGGAWFTTGFGQEFI